MYVAVKGGEKAIQNACCYLNELRRGEPTIPELQIEQIKQQMRLAVARVMTEGSLYDEDLAALAIKQAHGDLVEAIFLLRAYRTTLTRWGYTLPIDTSRMRIQRRISAAFKDLPGGQVLGPTFDYTQRLLDFSLLANNGDIQPAPEEAEPLGINMPRVTNILDQEGLIERESPQASIDPPVDLTRTSLQFPASRSTRLQNLFRGDEGFLLGLGYSTQRGFGFTHPYAGEIRVGEVDITIVPPELGFSIELGEIGVTECCMLNNFRGSADGSPRFTQGYGITFGHSERKAMAMALVDRSLRSSELDEEINSPAQDPEFVLYHSDNVEASGFVQHLKLPHYVDFQGDLNLLREQRQDRAGRTTNAYE
jgi:alpha-D-ribose 1-methylphosphonate 5-triphosphate synthase subunit PhnI